MQTRSDKVVGAPLVGRIPDALLRKVLLVDDEADGAEIAAVLLRSNGFEVVVAHSASEALQALQDDKEIGVVLSDIMMPDMTGLQLADTVRETHPMIKIVLMSGYVAPALLKNREHEYLFVEKPYKMDTLLKVLGS